jgi:prephenate dehydrogenase
MKVAVIGVAGAMGSFFASYFLARGAEVVGFDSRRARLPGIPDTKSQSSATKDADIALVATPFETTAKVCTRALNQMREGSLLIEISSVKGNVVSDLRRLAAKNRVRFLSIHPMFGPLLQRYGGMRIVVITEGAATLGEAKRLFPDAKLIPMSVEAHDALMAVMLSLTHLANIAYAKVVSETISPRTFTEVASPTSALQSALAQGVLSQDPSFIASIQTANRHTTSAVRRMALELLRLNEMLVGHDEKAFSAEIRALRRLFAADDTSMKRIYRAYESLSA